jgi:hypothetical protein
LSELRGFRNKNDARAYRALMFAKTYFNRPFKFLTLTSAKEIKHYNRKLHRLLVHLRKNHKIEYYAVRTSEGRGVYHLALISHYIDHNEIRRLWESLTGAWSIHISLERNERDFVKEMTGQKGVLRYSMSRGFLPKGIQKALNALRKEVMPFQRVRAYKMLARRLKACNGDLERAFMITRECMSQSPDGEYENTRQILGGESLAVA